MKKINSLVLSYNADNKSIYDICAGYRNSIKENSDNYYAVNINLYASLGKNKFEEHIKGLVADKEITHLFYFSPFCDQTIDPYFLKDFSEDLFVTMFFFDTEYGFELTEKYYAQMADLVVVPGYLSQFKFELLGIKAICPFTLYDKNYYKSKEGVEKDINVSFVGSLVGRYDRRDPLDYLVKNGIEKVELYGRCTSNGRIPFEDMIDVFNRSKINLNLSGMMERHLDFDIDKRMKQCKGRLAEIAMCGGFILTEYAPGLEQIFEINKELVVFYDEEDLLEKVKYYLSHDKERGEIAMRGYERAHREYETGAGFVKIFSKIKELEGKSRKNEQQIYFDDRFVKYYTSYRVRYIFDFLSAREFNKAFEEFAVFFKYRKLSLGLIWGQIRYYMSTVTFLARIYNFLRIKSWRSNKK